MSNRKSLLFSALCMSTLCVDGRVCAPLAELDATRYIGRWYQVYYNDLMKIFSNPDCSSALYGLMPNASLPTITVNNSGLSKGKDEKPISYIGYAVQKNPTEAGEFTLTLQGVPTKASYRICDVGEPTYLGKYHQYSIVTDDTGFSIYVMARNVSQFFEHYDAEVQTKLKELGYNGLFAPKKNRQHDCPASIYYPPWP